MSAFAEGAQVIARADKVMARLVREAGQPVLRPRARDAFQALVRSIVYQQLAGSAAAAIHGRVLERFGGAVSVEQIISSSVEELRTTGLSLAKAVSIKDLAEKIDDGTVLLTRVSRLTDEELIERLTMVRGIGRWTAEMFLMFQLRRPDVWPVGDFGVRKGYQLAYGLAEMPAPKALEANGDRFRPYRSVAAWYLWRAVDLAKST